MKILPLIITTLLLIFATTPYAQDGTATPEQPSEELLDQDGVFAAPVIVDGETLFVVRGFSALPASERAANIERRIIEIAELPDFIELDVRVAEKEQLGPTVCRVLHPFD